MKKVYVVTGHKDINEYDVVYETDKQIVYDDGEAVYATRKELIYFEPYVYNTSTVCSFSVYVIFSSRDLAEDFVKDYDLKARIGCLKSWIKKEDENISKTRNNIDATQKRIYELEEQIRAKREELAND